MLVSRLFFKLPQIKKRYGVWFWFYFFVIMFFDDWSKNECSELGTGKKKLMVSPTNNKEERSKSCVL